MKKLKTSITICSFKLSKKGMEFNMIILDRKRISVMLLIILVGIFTFSYKTTEKENKETQKYVAATPVANKVIILDAGHGIPDERGTK